jgi:hypothetical protein
MQAFGCVPVRKLAAGLGIRVTDGLSIFLFIIEIGKCSKHQFISTSFTANIGEDYL